jgi:hypothetical protein
MHAAVKASRGVLCQKLPSIQAPASLHTSAPTSALNPAQTQTTNAQATTTEQKPEEKNAPRKTQAQLDEELKQKLAGISGDGGDAGIEFEDGQPVSMKRSVKNNMFRYI